MKYTKPERLEIGRQVYNNELTKYEAAEQYGINYNTVRDYMRLYRDVNGLPAKTKSKSAGNALMAPKPNAPEYEEYADMTKEQLIRELVKARITEARLKKGYEVKGDGANKVFMPIDSKNTK